MSVVEQSAGAGCASSAAAYEMHGVLTFAAARCCWRNAAIVDVRWDDKS